MTKREDGIHWSKDFVEHLRSAHFALMALCLGLIALSLAHPTEPLDRALQQLKEIERLGAASTEGSHTAGVNFSDWVNEWAEIMVNQAIVAGEINTKLPKEQVVQARGEVISTDLSCKAPNVPRVYTLEHEWVLIHSADEENLPKQFLRTHLPGEGDVVETSALGLPAETKLDDFKALWNVLNRHDLQIVVPISIGSKVFLWNPQQVQWEEYGCGTKNIGGETAGFLHIGLLGDEERWTKLAKRVGDEPPRYGYISGDNTTFISLDQFNTVDFNGQGWFLAKYRTWKAGKFAESFPDLDELTVTISHQNLDTIERVLNSKRNESAETFEAFGIKVPAQIVMQFGILLILAAQAYFLTHLIELSKRLNPTDEGWDVAWVGVYVNTFARLIYFCSIALLPLASIYALAKRGFPEAFQLRSWPIVAMVIATELLLVFLIWRKTPRRGTMHRMMKAR
jgi:hypothetical protein